MTQYRIVRDDVIGHSRDIPENYDPMEVIMIRRGDAEVDEEIFDFLNGIFKSEADRVNKYTGNDPVIEEEVKKMGGFGAALVERTEEKARDKTERDRIASMLRRGKTTEEIADFCGYPIEFVKEVEKSMLVTA